MRNSQVDWNGKWEVKTSTEVSWYQASPRMSVELIEQLAPDSSSRILDVGGGVSTLTDALLIRGYTQLTVLDVSAVAITRTREQLRKRSTLVTWLVDDILTCQFTQNADIWHDRALFHFLTSAPERERYAEQMASVLSPGGHAIVATFAEDGPSHCSGLPVARYGETSLTNAMGGHFKPVSFTTELHRTPTGDDQPFIYGVFTPLAS